MNRNKTYNTKQKELIINIIKSKKKEFTVKEIYSEINEKTGLTTIYRVVDKLVDDGLLNKYINKDNVTYYQYLKQCNKENHFYLKCDNCGTLVHVDCDCIEDLSNHILKKHNFSTNKNRTILNGICAKCIKEANY